MTEMLIPVAADAAAGVMCCLAMRDPASHASRGHTPGTFSPTLLRVVVDTATRETLWVGPSSDRGKVVVEWMADAGGGGGGGGGGGCGGNNPSGRDVTVSEFWVVRARVPGGDVTVFEPATAYGGYVREAPNLGGGGSGGGGDDSGRGGTVSVRARTPSPPSLAALVAHRGGVFGASTAVPTGELVVGAGAREAEGRWPAPPIPPTPIVSMMVVAGWGTPADGRRLGAAVAVTAATALVTGVSTGGPLARRPMALLPPPPVGVDGDDAAAAAAAWQGRHARRRRRRVDLSAVADDAARERILRNREAAARANERRARAKRALKPRGGGGRGGGGARAPGLAGRPAAAVGP